MILDMVMKEYRQEKENQKTLFQDLNQAD